MSRLQSSYSATTITVDDFVYSALSVSGNTSTIFNATINTTFFDKFPCLNGLGVSMARADIALGDVIPMHTHPNASKMILIANGSVTAGLISSDTTVYLKTLKEGDIMVFPQGLLHFQVNTGWTQALLWVSFGSSSPGLQILSNALFSNNLPSELIEKTTFLYDDEVKRLKALLGGSRDPLIGKKDLSHAPGIVVPQDSHLPNSNGTPRNGIDIGGYDMGNKPKIEDMEMNLMSMEDGKMGMVTDLVGIKIRKMVR
ncbi:auxin-binding protein ABP19a-like [Vitis riparia]|uniref:auxin-binding protein ABP19a-like n=1 Tax=Vitis riparia TaxID=96939 RepID=UPI00155AABCC|nr:auxin-binding protein ABP19a-like [Vitis riparia]